RPPLYPLLLAPIVGQSKEPANSALSSQREMTWGIAVLHTILGVGTVALTMLAGKRLGLRPLPSLLTGLIVAFDPFLSFQSRMIMTETLAAFLLAWVLAASASRHKSRSIEMGLALGLAALCRPSTLAVAGLAVMAVLITDRADLRARCGSACKIVATILLVLS